MIRNDIDREMRVTGMLEIESRIRREFELHLRALSATADAKDIDFLAHLVVHSMSNPNRSFHRTEHLLGLLLPSDPILSLAALFHDIVYFQVDEGFPALANEFLNSIVRSEGHGLFLRESEQAVSPGIALVCAVFNILPGQKLDPMNGQNEFLSAVLAERYLSPFLPARILVQIVACIEATIPFRSKVKGVAAAQALALRLSKCNDLFHLGFEKAEISEVVKRAVHLANRDVQNFAAENHAWFLATTWLLLPERNARLRGDQFTFADYRKSVQKMVGFFNFLSADLVFSQFEGFPDADAFDASQKAAAKNIAIAREYLDAKLVAIGVLEVLVNLTGGDLPILKFLGDVRSSDVSNRRMEDYLPASEGPLECDPVVFGLLQAGRALETNFDLRNSPLAAFLMSNMSKDQWEDVSTACHQYFNGEITAIDCLMRIPLNVVTSIVSACSKSCPSRSGALMEILSSLNENQLGR